MKKNELKEDQFDFINDCIEQPSIELVEKYLKKWMALDNYTLQESSLEKLFTVTYPKNIEMDDVLVKVCTLNAFYSTNIYSPLNVAKHIVSLNIDSRLAINDIDLVNDISKVKVNENKMYNFYSFATKYCSHHNPETYPIYDNYVDKLLMFFNKKDGFLNFRKSDLRNYSKFIEILVGFQKFYGLGLFTLKEIDHYLWQAGKFYFKKTY